MKKISGIYLIKNTVTLRYRIGSSNNCFKRFSNYRSRLRGGLGNKLMQSDFNEYGESSYEFIILEECNMSELYIREAYYLELYIDVASYNSNKVNKDTKKNIRRGKEAANYKKMRSSVTAGTNNGNNYKLKVEDVLEIRFMLSEGVKQTAIASKFDVSGTLVYNIKIGKRWASV